MTSPEHGPVISMAGPLAEAYHRRCPVIAVLENGCGSSDFGDLKHRMGASYSDAALVALEIVTAKMLSENWQQVLAIAATLMKRPTLSYPEFCAVIGEDENEPGLVGGNTNYGRRRPGAEPWTPPEPSEPMLLGPMIVTSR
jgi:hypothetical protein